jgi:hypothetical protein
MNLDIAPTRQVATEDGVGARVSEAVQWRRYH